MASLRFPDPTQLGLSGAADAATAARDGPLRGLLGGAQPTGAGQRGDAQPARAGQRGEAEAPGAGQPEGPKARRAGQSGNREASGAGHSGPSDAFGGLRGNSVALIKSGTKIVLKLLHKVMEYHFRYLSVFG